MACILSKKEKPADEQPANLNTQLNYITELEDYAMKGVLE
ncbi:hypothetical protein SAMN02745885_01621 [Carboxydocella sporoproducens DSM 16521]|uniref:Uncharacterized protein n=2 Tax=Carboxydocella TaxID=178898 RepID=A0A1T4QEA3_9FIRM|nr:hypothetical protein CFE_2487 [Carboxydocella thermautotrophica]SKA01831.1 hypothetical protein SAMN02745885_01621 [Carboxydocella sporoproducens DSM 16521]